MPTRDFVHDILIRALVKDGWTITADPYFLKLGRRDGYIDLAADRMIAATKENEKIAVEGKSFASYSKLTEFEKALGQFSLYLLALEEKEPDRILYLAMPNEFYQEFMEDPFFQKVINFTPLFKKACLVYQHNKENKSTQIHQKATQQHN